MRLTNKALNRFSKQIILKNIGISGQKKIFSAKVLVIGAGGLGCPLILYLANSGVGNIGIVDDDKVDLTNLNRQILFTNDDLGKFKVVQAKKVIKKINKDIKVTIFKKKITKNNIANTIKKFDIICDGTDNFETRLLINDFCLKKKKILISAAVSGFDGHLFKFDFRKGTPCYRCFMPETPSEQLNCETEGVTPTITGILGTLQANEVLNSILNLNSNLEKKLLIFNSIDMNFRKVRLSKNKYCKNKC